MRNLACLAAAGDPRPRRLQHADGRHALRRHRQPGPERPGRGDASRTFPSIRPRRPLFCAARRKPALAAEVADRLSAGGAARRVPGGDNDDLAPAAFCSGLPANLQSQWWAYPTGWPDTATETDLRLGGYYDPARTISISGGQMHIRLFRDTGPIHSASRGAQGGDRADARKVRGTVPRFRSRVKHRL